MDSVIKLTPDLHHIYRYIENVDASMYPTSDWLPNPDLSAVTNVPKQYWKPGGSPLAVVEMNQSEKDLVDEDYKDQINVSVAGTLAFEKSGYCANRWIGFGQSKSSNSTPFICANRMTITGITFSNLINSVETDIELYQNGIKIYTWEVRDKRWAWITKGLHALSFNPGDKLSVYMRDKGTNPRHVIITLHYLVWSQEVGEGGSSTL